jgi:Zn-dependent M28 family amino/carboxypeptidase
LKTFISIALVFVGAVALMLFYFTKMPGVSPAMSTAALSEDEKGAADRIGEACEALAHVIGQRSTAKAHNVVAAREYIEQRLGKMGLRTREKAFATRGYQGVNIETEVEGSGSRSEILVLGAHYDTDAYSPGADENASGCAMLFELARALTTRPHDRTIDIVFFDFGSSRFAGSEDAGSHFWAEDARKSGKRIAAMLSIDSVGRFTDAPGSQGGPFPLSLCYPSQGNFLLFVGDIGSRQLVQTSVEMVRAAGGFPCEGITMPGLLPWLDGSDHHAFRQNGWPAMVVTDTGPLRNHEHGTPSDTPDRLNYPRMGVAWSRLLKLVERLAQAGTAGVSVMN